MHCCSLAKCFSPLIIRLPLNVTCFMNLITRFKPDALLQELREDRIAV